MKEKDTIVACGGWFKREVRFRPLHLVAKACALVSSTFTGVIGSLTAYVWFYDGRRPEDFLVNTSGIGVGLTLALVALTVFIGKGEKERKVTVTTRNPHYDPKCLY